MIQKETNSNVDVGEKQTQGELVRIVTPSGVKNAHHGGKVMTDKWMTCTTCKAIVQLNATGTCLGCQGGFAGQQDADRYIPIETKLRTKEEEIAQLVERQKELEDALRVELIKLGMTVVIPKGSKAQKEMEEAYDAIQKSSTEKVHVQPKAEASKGVRRSNSKRKKATTKGKKE